MPNFSSNPMFDPNRRQMGPQMNPATSVETPNFSGGGFMPPGTMPPGQPIIRPQAGGMPNDLPQFSPMGMPGMGFQMPMENTNRQPMQKPALQQPADGEIQRRQRYGRALMGRKQPRNPTMGGPTAPPQFGQPGMTPGIMPPVSNY